MYIPRPFQPTHEETTRLLGSVVAGDLISATDDGLVATFLPVLVRPEVGEHGTIEGHLARNNPQWQSLARGETLFISNGPDAYISPSWYASKADHGRVVPTWNYVAVHVYGALLVHDDEAWLYSLLGRLTDRHELHRESPWSVDDAPAAFVAGQLKAIVGVELVISRVEVKVKMSQNRPDADLPGVIDGLRAEGLNSVADMVASAGLS